MPDESVWEIPGEVVAKDCAAYYAERESGGKPGDEEYDATYNEMMSHLLTGEGASELVDWAENNMDWKDVRENARMVETPPPPDYEEGWLDAVVSAVDHD